MNKKLQTENEMQDDELYALLDSAMADDRLCVSEDLIQRTLQKVKDENKSVTVAPRKPKYRTLVQYAGMAAAALLIVFVGSNAIKNVNKESASDMAAPRAETANSGDNKWYYSTADSADGASAPSADGAMSDGGSDAAKDEIAYVQSESEAPKERDGDVPADTADAYMGSKEIIISDKFQSLLKTEGYELSGEVAECWDYAGEADNAEAQMEEVLLNGTVIEGLNTIGRYRYQVTDGDGNQKNIVSELPIDRIIRIPTRDGALWFLLGAENMVFTE